MPCRVARVVLMLFGSVNLVCGVVGLFLPLMPSTVFLLMALWAFSRSSLRFHGWLYNHPRLGRPLRDWHRHRVIPPRVKLAAVVSLGISCAIVLATMDAWPWIAAICGVLAGVGLFVLTRPHRAPADVGTAGMGAGR